MSDRSFGDALNLAAAALESEVGHGGLLWSTPDGQRCYGNDTAEGCTMTVVSAGTQLVYRIMGVQLAAFT